MNYSLEHGPKFTLISHASDAYPELAIEMVAKKEDVNQMIALDKELGGEFAPGYVTYDIETEAYELIDPCTETKVGKSWKKLPTAEEVRACFRD